ncbi:hypothetical protein CPC08DRAFT_193491 [Agrocybe pediades]|nr:hypothetical protein CPC08DRAFT_193491 [Agrocybe pediades]
MHEYQSSQTRCFREGRSLNALALEATHHGNSTPWLAQVRKNSITTGFVNPEPFGICVYVFPRLRILGHHDGTALIFLVPSSLWSFNQSAFSHFRVLNPTTYSKISQDWDEEWRIAGKYTFYYRFDRVFGGENNRNLSLGWEKTEHWTVHSLKTRFSKPIDS